MIEKQKKEEGEALVSTVLFSNESVVVHDRVDIREVGPLTDKEYCPGGCTALIDAMGGAIRHISSVQKYIREEDVPERTLFVIITDGMENASRRYTAEEVRKLVEEKKEKNGWEFLFLGANIDAVQTAARYGIQEDRAVTFRNDHVGQKLNYHTVNKAAASLRSGERLTRDWKEEIEKDFSERKE